MRLMAGFIGKNKDFKLIEIQQKVRQAQQNFSHADKETVDVTVKENLDIRR